MRDGFWGSPGLWRGSYRPTPKGRATAEQGVGCECGGWEGGLNASPSLSLHHLGVPGRSLDLSGPQSAHL